MAVTKEPAKGKRKPRKSKSSATATATAGATAPAGTTTAPGPATTTTTLRTTIESLRQVQAASREEFGRPKKTKKSYKGYLARGRKFLSDLVAERKAGNNSPSHGDNAEGTEEIDTDILAKAFDCPPNKYSALALELFLTQKCFTEGCGKDTVAGIQGAFTDFWDNMDGETYAGQYIYHKATDTVTGCPARASGFKKLIKTVNTRARVEGAAASRQHAEAMLLPALTQMMDWSESVCPAESMKEDPKTIEELKNALIHGLMRAFSASGTTLWTRNFELCKLQARHITWGLVGPAPAFSPYFSVFLENRKGWQQKSGWDGPLESNHYDIYPQDIPAMDMYTHLLRWVGYLERRLGRPLAPDDYIFPYISPNGIIEIRREMTPDVIQKHLTDFTTGAGLEKHYSTHCFRRGGAQYRFMYAPLGQRWSLAAVRWWGGWADGENVDTLMKYLIDSLQSYESTYKDMLCPTGPSQATVSFMGEHALFQPVSAGEFRMFSAAMMAKQNTPPPAVCQNCRASSIPTHPLPQVSTTPTHGASVEPQLPDPCPSTATFQEATVYPSATDPISLGLSQTSNMGSGITSQLSSSPNRRQSSTSSDKENPRMIQRASIPYLGRGKEGWRRMLQQWNDVDPQTGLALKDWPDHYYKGDNKGATASNRSKCKTIADEYQLLGGTDAQFLAVYPAADTQSVTRLVDNIRARHGRQRKSKNGTPGERGRIFSRPGAES
ncbi:hypothetical protein Hypma_002250 [Hypsizygus marmoreus]|uniref:Tyr recombinase domain-containing protein n=1 Tax=Hypsizygus marmoreus TaxID=39966 RepID=A0A369K7V1_HYPMA|nr:hypothetical protein Hypma_002250 [Hypsizygus marmoreus]